MRTWLRRLWFVLVFLALGGIVSLQVGDPFGDRGMANAFSYVLGMLAGALLLGRFLLARGLPLWSRVGTLLAAAAVLVLLNRLYVFEGWSGALVPHFRARAQIAGGPRDVLPENAAAVDLTAVAPTDFPGFLGPDRDGRAPGPAPRGDWENTPPEILWQRPVGAGWSGFAVAAGVAVTLEQRGDDEVLAAYDLESGTPLWSAARPGRTEHFLGGDGPRSTPAIAGGRVVALGSTGLLRCHDGADGRLIWEHDLLAEWGVTPEFETAQVQYGRANSPLVFDGRVVVPVGGDPEGRCAGLAAFALEDGALLWEGPPRNVSFASPTLTELAGVRQILIVNEASLSGHDPDTGALLWEHDWPGRTSADANVSQAMPLPPDRVLVSKGYGGGALCLRLVPTAEGGLASEEVWRNPRALRTKFTNPVVHGDHAYGLSDGVLECVSLADGERVWRSGRYGHGQMLGVEDRLLVVSEEGEVVLLAATPDAPGRELARLPVLEGKTWNNPALAGGVLVLRNGRGAAALRLPREEP